MINCELTEMSYYDNEGSKNVKVYGLRFYFLENKGRTIKSTDNLFCEKQRAIWTMKRINTEGISEIHIDDVIEDAITDIRDNLPPLSLVD